MTVFLCFLCLHSVCFGQAKPVSSVTFPTNEEIQLVVSQSETAFDQYRQSLASEALLPSVEKDKSGLEKDQQVAEMSRKLTDVLKKNPEKFNGLAGLLLLTTLDDASRNAALCASSGMTDMAGKMLTKLDTAFIYQMMNISQKCTDVSLQLYTVSESVNALFVRSVEAQGDLNQEAMDTINACSEALKKAAQKK